MVVLGALGAVINVPATGSWVFQGGVGPLLFGAESGSELGWRLEQWVFLFFGLGVLSVVETDRFPFTYSVGRRIANLNEEVFPNDGPADCEGIVDSAANTSVNAGEQTLENVEPRL
jgi:hypothetical protein